MGKNKWQYFKLEELANNFDSLRVPIKKSERNPGPYPYYGASGVIDYVDKYIFEGEYLLVAEDGENLRARKTPIAFIADKKFWVNNHAHVIKGNAQGDTKFLKYALDVAPIGRHVTGSAVPKLSQASLNEIQIFAPPLPEQQRIAHILGTLDEKIDLNHKMSTTLWNIALELFKSWFIDFEPVWDKVEGAKDRERANEVDLPIPTFEKREFGLVPTGWKVTKLDELITEVSERNGKRFDLVLSAVNTGDLIRSDDYFDKRVYSKDLSKYKVVYPLQFAYNPARVNIGSIGINEFDEPGLVSPVYIVFKAKDGFEYFVRNLLLRPEIKTAISGLASGSVRQNLRFGDLASIQIVLPSKNVIEKFTDFYLEIVGQIRTIETNSQSVAMLRDALLPKLMQGEI